MFGIKNKRKHKNDELMRNNKRVSHKLPPSIISSDVNFLGNIISEGTLDIDGNIEGNIRAKNIIIHKNGFVKGEIVAKNVSSTGKIRGLIRAQEVTLLDGADVKGIIIHEKLSMEEGAVVDAKFKQQSTVFLDNSDENNQDSILKKFNLVS